jgi:mRNA interferase MazF
MAPTELVPRPGAQSRGSVHEKTAFAIACPITSNVTPYPFKVPSPDGLLIGGAVLADQVKSIDRTARQLKVAGTASRSAVVEVQAKIAAILGIDGT